MWIPTSRKKANSQKKIPGKEDVKRRVVRSRLVITQPPLPAMFPIFSIKMHKMYKMHMQKSNLHLFHQDALTHVSINSIFYTGNQTFLLFKYKVYIKHIVYENVIFVILDCKMIYFYFLQ